MNQPPKLPEARNLLVVIDQMLEIIPLDEIEMRGSLDLHYTSNRYRAPEVQDWNAVAVSLQFYCEGREEAWINEVLEVWRNDKEIARLNAPEPVTGEAIKAALHLGAKSPYLMKTLLEAAKRPAPPPAGAKGEPASDPYKLETHEGVFDQVSDMENSVFRITWKNASYYVNLPGYNGGEVVPATIARRVVKRLKSKLAGVREELAEAKRERDELQAARIAYAREFAPNNEGNPDVGSIHQNIRQLRADLDSARNWRSFQDELPEIGVTVVFVCETDGNWSGPDLGKYTGMKTEGDAIAMDYWDADDWLPCTHWLPLPPTPSSEQEPVREGGEG